MSIEKPGSQADVWGSRYDDRDADDLGCDRWSLRMAMREKAIAQPFKNFTMPEDKPLAMDLREAANDSKPR